jgi:hypothetical protein
MLSINILNISHDKFNKEIESSVVLEENGVILFLGGEQLDGRHSPNRVSYK